MNPRSGSRSKLTRGSLWDEDGRVDLTIGNMPARYNPPGIGYVIGSFQYNSEGSHRELLLADADPVCLLDRLNSYTVPIVDKWINRSTR
jgi:hypothetical protein